MQIIGRVSAFALVVLFAMNVFLGLVHALLPHRAVLQAEVPRRPTLKSQSLVVPIRAIDVGAALSGPVTFFSDRIVLDVRLARLVRTRTEVRLDLVVTPRAAEGYTVLHIDQLAVDATRTAIVTTDGSWFQVWQAEGVGLLNAGEIVRRSPVYVVGAPRRMNLGFAVPSSVVGEILLLVRWAPGRSALYADGWRIDRVVELNLPPPR